MRSCSAPSSPRAARRWRRLSSVPFVRLFPVPPAIPAREEQRRGPQATKAPRRRARDGCTPGGTVYDFSVARERPLGLIAASGGGSDQKVSRVEGQRPEEEAGEEGGTSTIWSGRSADNRRTGPGPPSATAPRGRSSPASPLAPSPERSSSGVPCQQLQRVWRSPGERASRPQRLVPPVVTAILDPKRFSSQVSSSPGGIIGLFLSEGEAGSAAISGDRRWRGPSSR